MAVNPVIIAETLKAVTSEESRNKIIIGIAMIISLFMVIIFLPIYILLHPIETLSMFFGNNEMTSIEEIKAEYPYILESDTKRWIGRFPMPIDGTLTSDYGNRNHPITVIFSKHEGLDISGVHHDKVCSIADGVVTMAETQRGYGNCIEIKHEIITYETVVDEDGNETTIKHTEIFYSFYAHLSRIDVVEGMQVRQGNVIGIEGGDPKTDGYVGNSTDHHLHFEIRLKSGGDTVDPKDYIY